MSLLAHSMMGCRACFEPGATLQHSRLDLVAWDLERAAWVTVGTAAACRVCHALHKNVQSQHMLPRCVIQTTMLRGKCVKFHIRILTGEGGLGEGDGEAGLGEGEGDGLGCEADRHLEFVLHVSGGEQARCVHTQLRPAAAKNSRPQLVSKVDQLCTYVSQVVLDQTSMCDIIDAIACSCLGQLRATHARTWAWFWTGRWQLRRLRQAQSSAL